MASAAIPQEILDPLAEPAPAGLTRSGVGRLDAVDMLRGLVIAIMVLDHVRDFFHIDAASFDPTDPLRTTPILFATRWVTHLCAPTFVFLAGLSIFFQKANGKAPGALSAFLLKRGLWLVLLEFTVVSFGFNFGEPFAFLQVIWAIGFAMFCMALIARLPSPVVLVLGVAILLLYPFVEAPTAGATGAFAVLRTLLLAPGLIGGAPIVAFYAGIPWLGVMCLGFGMGPVYRLPEAERRRVLLPLAVGLIATFLLVRGLDGYGDPNPWVHEPTATRTMLSFFDISKYPPSPDYVCATLGVSLLLFLGLGYLKGPAARVLLDFGRTPLFTYVCHIYIAHGLMLLAVLATGYPAGTAFNVIRDAFAGKPAVWGFGLPIVYLVWAIVVASLIPLSRWFAGVKRRRRDWWLSYL